MRGADRSFKAGRFGRATCNLRKRCRCQQYATKRSTREEDARATVALIQRFDPGPFDALFTRLTSVPNVHNCFNRSICSYANVSGSVRCYICPYDDSARVTFRACCTIHTFHVCLFASDLCALGMANEISLGTWTGIASCAVSCGCWFASAIQSTQARQIQSAQPIDNLSGTLPKPASFNGFI